MVTKNKPISGKGVGSRKAKRRPHQQNNGLLLKKRIRNRKQAASTQAAKTSVASRPDRDSASSKQSEREERSTHPLWPAYLSSLVLWLSFPPVALGWLAWLAPMGWLSFIDRPALRRRDYVHLWLSGCIFWLAILQGIRLAYWPLYFGWIALSLYLAAYIPLFVYIARRLLDYRFPLALSAAVSWTSLELVRSYMLTGYAANSLAHTQAHYPLVIQIADQVGGIGLGFLMMLFCAAIYRVCRIHLRPETDESRTEKLRGWLGIATASGLVLASLAYGWYKLREADQLYAQSEPMLSVLLVQENTPSMFDADLSNPRQAWTGYLEATRSLVAEHGKADLVVWPESTFTAGSPWVDKDLPPRLPPQMIEAEMDRGLVAEWLQRTRAEFELKTRLVLEAAGQDETAETTQERAESVGGDSAVNEKTRSEKSPAAEAQAKQSGPSLLVGSDAWEITELEWRRFNSALLIDSQGSLVDRYDKMHLVMFGEYIPLGPLLQWLRDQFGISGIDAGIEPARFMVGGTSISPSICFESTLPRLIRRQVRELRASGRAPELLINITNDSWFRGSSLLDHHLACSILCAVENRLPLLVAANTGLSAEIDGCGRLNQVTERLTVDGIKAEPKRDSRAGLVQTAGYPLAWICLGLSLTVVLPSSFVKSFQRSDEPRGVN